MLKSMTIHEQMQLLHNIKNNMPSQEEIKQAARDRL